MKTNKWQEAQKKEISSWLDTDMTSKKLIKLWTQRLDHFKDIVNKLTPESSVLDVGSGPISVLHVFPKTKLMVAIDPLNDQYKNKYERKPYIKYISSQAEILKFKDNTFDVITCINALDHMEKYEAVLKEMSRCLKPGGLLYLEYENTSPLSVFLAQLGYKKPLDDFHPVLMQNRNILSFLKRSHLKIVKSKYGPQLNRKKIQGIMDIVMGKHQVTDYEKKISVLNYGKLRTISHYFIISVELIFSLLSPSQFAYFTTLTAEKK